MRMMTNTDNFKALAVDAIGRNREPSPELLERLDPEGVHITSIQRPHEMYVPPGPPRKSRSSVTIFTAPRAARAAEESYVELRTLWLVKVVGEVLPVEVFMDNSFAAMKKLTVPCED